MNYPIVAYIFLFLLFNGCSNRNTSNTKISGDGTEAKNSNVEKNNIFHGEYLIGDGGINIVAVNKHYELRNEFGMVQDSVYFVGNEDKLIVYANKDKSIIFKMNSDNKSGMYYQADEKWPVSYMGEVSKIKTESEETEELLKKRYIEDSIAYSQLDSYNGTYHLFTESEGATAKLVLHYNYDKTFTYSWDFKVDMEQTKCKAKRKGVFTMDRTQHGFEKNGDCLIHFNLNGFWNKAMTVELEFEDQTKCLDLKGDCIFSGIYTTQ